LAQILELTEGELADMAYIPQAQLRNYLRTNSFPMAVAGHLENIERWVKSSRLGVRFQRGTAQDIVLQEKAKALP